MFDILVPGEINPDLILSGNVFPEFGQTEKLVDQAVLAVGSSSAIFACGAARLGLKVAFVGICGDDIFGRFMLDEMSRCNVNVENVIIRKDGQTGLSVILNDRSDRAILTYPGLIAALQESDIPDALFKQARHLHVASYFLQTKLQPDLPKLFSRAHAFGLTTSLDTNWDPANQWLGFDHLLSHVDVFLPNENEARAITHTDQVEAALAALASRSNLVAVKRGADGALAQRKGGSIVSTTSIAVKVIDTVGAGDTFDAGFLFGHLNDWELAKSIRLAAICGALSTQCAGGTQGQPMLEEALKYL